MRPHRLPLLCLFFALASPPALAQSASVKELFDNGQLHYDSGSYDLAIEAWTEALAQSGRPVLLIKLADAHEAAGAYNEAIALLERYLEQAEESEVETIQARIDRLSSEQPSPAPAPEPAATPEPAPAPAAPEPEESPPTRRSPVPDIVLGGTTAVGLGVGLGAGLSALSARNTALESCAGPRTGAVCTPAAADALSRDATLSTVADIGFAVGGVAAVVWTVHGLTRGTPQSALALHPTGLSLRF